MKLKSLFAFIIGLAGISLITAQTTGAEVLSQKMEVKKKSYEEASHGTQDWYKQK